MSADRSGAYSAELGSVWTERSRTLSCGCRIVLRYRNGQDNGSAVVPCASCAKTEYGAGQ